MLLLFICIIAMLSVFSTVAHASWTGSFGGAGGSGTVGSGYWLEARVQRVACLMAWEMGGPPRVGPGYLLGVGAGRGQRWVPLHAIPRRGVGGGLETGPRGNCVAFMPHGGIGF